MNISVEQLEGHMAKLTIELEADLFEKAIDAVYRQQRNRINVPGFRKGKAPRVLIEKMYGSEIFYEDAANKLIEDEYPNAYDECEIDIVSQPEIDIIQVEKGKPFIFTALVAQRPPVELGKYMGVTVTRVDSKVTKEELKDEIDRVLKMNARSIKVEDRPVKSGDRLKMDYAGRSEGKLFDGGSAKDAVLTVGSNTFIPGFEDQLIGHNIGEEFDVNVTFPDEYHAPELAGKPAVFTVTIHEITEEQLPELNDEFVQDISEFETVDEYKKDVEKTVSERKERTARRQKEEEAVQKIVESSKMDIPEPMIDTQVENMMREFSQNMAMQGISMQQYFAMTGMSPEAMRTQMREDAEKQVRTSLVLEEIVKVEGIEATDEDVEEKVREMSTMYMVNADEMLKSLTDRDRDRIKKDVQVEKAVKLIGDNLKERAKPKKKEETEGSDDSAAEKKETKKTTRKTTKKEKED